MIIDLDYIIHLDVRFEIELFIMLSIDFVTSDLKSEVEIGKKMRMKLKKKVESVLTF